nr:lipoprotein-releasing ABC transporter permease subunit [Thiolinea sp.]
ISGTDGRLAGWEALSGRLEQVAHVTGVAPFIKKQVMITHDNLMRGVQVQGIDPARQGQVSEMNLRMLEGGFDSLVPRGYGIVLGVGLANYLRVFPGDKVTVISPQVQVTPAGLLPRLRRFTVVGIHEFGMQEYDNMTAFIELGDAARLFRFGDEVSGMRLKLDDLFEAPVVAATLQNELGDGYEVMDWGREHGSFFQAVRTEKVAMGLILFLVVAVALFNLVASLVMAVKDKESDIAILRTFGLEPRRVMHIFMIQGSIIGVFGTLVGVLCGVLLSLNIHTIVPLIEGLIGRKIFPEDLFYISEIPSDLHWDQVIWIGMAALVFAVLATLYPAWRAARVHPVESLRYE